MTNQQIDIIEEVKTLISYSINSSNTDSNFKDLHKAIIARYFEAKNVEINYDSQSVSLELPVGQKQYTNLTFECQKLKRFLKSCLKKDDESLSFYQSLLDDHKITSAA